MIFRSVYNGVLKTKRLRIHVTRETRISPWNEKCVLEGGIEANVTLRHGLLRMICFLNSNVSMADIINHKTKFNVI